MRWILKLGGTTLAASALVFAACGDDDSQEPLTSTPVGTAQATATVPENTPVPTTVPVTATQAAPDTVLCVADDLSLEVNPAGGAAGTHFQALAVTNDGQAECTIAGFPGVSLVNSSGATLGEPADRNTAESPEPIELDPGETAHAMVALPNYQNFPEGTCEGPSASLVLYPPEDTAALAIPFEDYACPGLSVQVFQPGANEPGRS